MGSNGSGITGLSQHPTYQPILIQGAQAEIASVSPLFWGAHRKGVLQPPVAQLSSFGDEFRRLTELAALTKPLRRKILVEIFDEIANVVFS